MSWKIITTKEFSIEFKKYRKNNKFIDVLEKKIQRLKQNPNNVGGYLSGRLHGYKSTRIINKLRLVFKVDVDNSSITFIGIDHRKFDYERF
jgi:mRNA-degrading endonuclease RelE of RelBE toxin-antitoxin system